MDKPAGAQRNQPVGRALQQQDGKAQVAQPVRELLGRAYYAEVKVHELRSPGF